MMTSMFLLYVKVTSELKEKKERARFLRCMGMQRKERIRMLKKRNIFVLLAANAVSYLPDIVFYDCDFSVQECIRRK